MESGLLARKMAVVMTAEHLLGGHDVIVPQYLGRAAFIEELDQVASRTDSSFHELVLTDTRENAIRRFHARAENPEERVHHREAAALTAGDTHLGEMYDRLSTLVEQRPGAQVVATTAGDIDGAYRSVMTYLNGPDRPACRYV